MLPTPYLELNQVLATFLSVVQRSLGGDLLGVYLQGSFALGEFDDHSDVDFVVVVNRELRASVVKALQDLHAQIFKLDSEWAKHLEGSYFPLETLQDHSKRGSELWYLDHGAHSLIRSEHCNTLLVRWVLREKGVALFGPPPKTLLERVPSSKLRGEILHTIFTWGAEILATPSRFGNRFYQGFIVLNFCRMLHDLRRGYPGSKREGADWAKKTLDPAWSALIDRAWMTRPDPASKVREPADPEDFIQTLRLVEFAIEEGKRCVAGGTAPSSAL